MRRAQATVLPIGNDRMYGVHTVLIQLAIRSWPTLGIRAVACAGARGPVGPVGPAGAQRRAAQTHQESPLDMRIPWHGPPSCALPPTSSLHPCLLPPSPSPHTQGWLPRSGLLYGTDFTLYQVRARGCACVGRAGVGLGGRWGVAV